MSHIVQDILVKRLEIYMKHEDAEYIWDKILETGKDMGIKPAGLGARDISDLKPLTPLWQ